ncbi:hypothetical protein PflCFBP13510_01620 [Pseudomonas fluorescens]|nr:hypothetical protein PflCFBP13510_01620 [Pseudomonas fluorescens]
MSGNYGQDRDNKHLDAGASGSVIVHRGGVTLGQPVGETFALAEVPGTKGIGVDSSNAVRTDGKGYVVVPYVQHCRYNWINLDPSTFGSGIEIVDTSHKIVPTRGAILKTTFKAESGRRLQFVVRLSNGQKLSFGAQAIGGDGDVLGTLDNASRLLLFGVKDQGSFDVQWKNGSCRVSYSVPPVNRELMCERFDVVCISS